MSILDSLKVLDKPISELAKLPQQTIMQLAQNKQIPMGFVAPILAEKAEQAKTGAEIAAVMQSQELPPSSILERIITENAVAEAAPANMPQQVAPQGMPPAQPMMQDAGIASLPVPEEAMPKEFAGGGIVAFAGPEGSLVEDPNASAVDYKQFGDLGQYLQEAALAREKFIGKDKSVADLYDYVKKAEQQAAFDADKNFYNRIFKAGLNIMGGTSPYAFENIGKGAAPEVEGYMSDIAKQRAADLERQKLKAELGGKERAEREKVLAGALTRRSEKEKAAAELAKEQADRANRLAVAMVPPDVVRGARAIMLPGEKLEDAVSRYTNITNTKDQYNAAAGLVQAAYTAASKEYTAAVGAGGPLYSLALAANGDKDALRSLGLTKDQAVAALAEKKTAYFDAAYEGVGMRPEEARRFLRQPSNTTGTANRTNPPGTANKTYKFPVTAPDGTTYYFESQEKADAFKARIPSK